jgi:hypothetical protein
LWSYNTFVLKEHSAKKDDDKADFGKAAAYGFHSICLQFCSPLPVCIYNSTVLNGCGLAGNKVKKWNLRKGYHPKETADNRVFCRKARECHRICEQVAFSMRQKPASSSMLVVYILCVLFKLVLLDCCLALLSLRVEELGDS